MDPAANVCQGVLLLSAYELSPGIGVIPTFVFYVVLYMAIMRLQPIAVIPEWAFLSFNHRLSFR